MAEVRVEQGVGSSGVEAAAPPPRAVGARAAAAEVEAAVPDAARALATTAYLLVGERHRAEELTQQAYERVWRARPPARPHPRPHAPRALGTLRVDHWRRRRRERLVDVVPERAHAAGDDAVVLRDELVRALITLPPRQRRVVVLRHLLDLSVEQVSVELGVTPGTVKASVSRGLAALRVVLGEEHP